ncbi:MAG: hypothetical protein LH618_02125 [Saprospiraceae bacterium]|nr:hypothetical protein [Saprospiraceae bacterium]
MKNWLSYVRISAFAGFTLLMMAANCTSSKPPQTASPAAPAVVPATGQSGTAGHSSAQPPSSGTRAEVPKEVGQGAAPDQAQVDSLKAAAAKERAKSQKKKPGG